MRVTAIVLPQVAAEVLLADPATACFAPLGRTTDDEATLCRRVVAALKAGGASYLQRHMAAIAAALAGRYDALVTAMNDAQFEPVIIEDLVKFGEDRGEARGEARGLGPLVHQFERRLKRPLTDPERTALHGRLGALGPERLGDVVLDLAPEALGPWLADPSAQ